MRPRHADSRGARRISSVRRGRRFGGAVTVEGETVPGQTRELMLSRLRQSARDRAGRRCEYCRFHENDLPLWPFHLDHIVAEQHAGKNQLDNVAWAC